MKNMESRKREINKNNKKDEKKGKLKEREKGGVWREWEGETH